MEVIYHIEDDVKPLCQKEHNMMEEQCLVYNTFKNTYHHTYTHVPTTYQHIIIYKRYISFNTFITTTTHMYIYIKSTKHHNNTYLPPSPTLPYQIYKPLTYNKCLPSSFLCLHFHLWVR